VYTTHLELGTGYYRIEITFSCSASNPSYRITRFEMARQAPACDGSMNVALKVLSPPESIAITVQYGGSATLQVKKIIYITGGAQTRLWPVTAKRWPRPRLCAFLVLQGKRCAQATCLIAGMAG
jgi:hypothetical protein